MLIYLIIYFLILINLIHSIDLSFLTVNYFTKEEDEMNKLLKPIIQSYITSNKNILNNLPLSEQCISKLNKTYFITQDLYSDTERNKNNTQKLLYYYNKLIYSFIKNQQFFDSPEICQDNYINVNSKDNRNSNLEKLTYISVFIKNEDSYYNELKSNKNNMMINFFGVCVVDGCEKDDYIKLIEHIINYININNTEKNNTDNNNINLKEKIFILYMDNKQDEKIYLKILKLIPLIFILIHILFLIFNKLPLYLYNLILLIFCCQNEKTRKKGSIKIKRVLSKDKGQLVPKDANNPFNDINSSSSSINSNIDKVNEMINLLFNTEKNFETLMEYNKQNEYFNDTGLSYNNGIKGLSMIFFLFGNVFIALYNSPIIEQNRNLFFNDLKSLRYFIFYFGIKYSPKILICCSGYSLFYKFVCFLDDKVESEKEIQKQREEKENRLKSEDLNSNSSNDKNKINEKKKSVGSKIFNFKSLVSVKYLYIFIGYQIHKYILYLLIISFFLFSFYEVVSYFHGPGLVWDYFNQKMIEPSFKIEKLIPLLFGLQGYILTFIIKEKISILNYFNIVYQEIFYFIISTIIIFIGYKKNLKIDFFFKILILILFLVRILFYFIFNLNIRDYFSFQTYQSYGPFYTSIIYNYIYYLIGIYFGMLNYIIQKKYSYLECKKNKKIYLISGVKIIEIIKKRKNFPHFLGIMFFIILLLNNFLQPILIYIFQFIYKNSMIECMENYDKSIFVVIFMMIDTDVIILGINIMGLFMYLKGNNFINNFLNNNYWSIFNKFYFSYILLINPIILYVIYISETKIKFDINNCFLISFICAILVFASTSIFFIIFELPYKKPLKYLLKLSEKEINDERYNNIENTFNYSQIESQGELLEESNSDDDEYLEDEEDEDD